MVVAANLSSSRFKKSASLKAKPPKQVTRPLMKSAWNASSEPPKRFMMRTHSLQATLASSIILWKNPRKILCCKWSVLTHLMTF